MVRWLGARVYYGWIAVAVTALLIIMAAGVRSAPGVFMVPMLLDSTFDRATLSFAASMGLLLYGLAAPLSGALIDRFGPRRTMIAGMLLVIAAMALSAPVVWSTFMARICLGCITACNCCATSLWAVCPTWLGSASWS